MNLKVYKFKKKKNTLQAYANIICLTRTLRSVCKSSIVIVIIIIAPIDSTVTSTYKVMFRINKKKKKILRLLNTDIHNFID